jgi:hypothetical protein
MILDRGVRLLSSGSKCGVKMCVGSSHRLKGNTMGTINIDDLERLQGLDKDVVTRRARRKAALDQARAVREKITARVGGILPDSADELRELREERTDELAGLRC